MGVIINSSILIAGEKQNSVIDQLSSELSTTLSYDIGAGLTHIAPLLSGFQLWKM
jgi:actin-related protein